RPINAFFVLIGSPPRAWGQLRMRLIVSGVLRFTPTCVGTTCPARTTKRDATVHPHVRGDNGLSSLVTRTTTGSPPRAWGQRSSHRAELFHQPVHPHV